MTPRATYRLQLRAGFDFDDVAGLAAYLADLGVSHVYCSPILAAVKGSTHGYDVVDPRVIDPELGGEGAYTRMTSSLRQHGLGQVLDIVPNHMATDPANPWWWDVLANGPSSRYAGFFDIDWEGPREESWSKVLVPVLGDHYGRVLEEGSLDLVRSGAHFEIRYHDQRLPISPESSAVVLASAARRSGQAGLAEIGERLRRLPTTRSDRTVALERHHLVEELEGELEATLADGPTAVAVDAEVAAISDDVDRLDELLDEQNYRLAYWKTANEEIDYRRFFSIETLVGVRADVADVFAETHRLVLDLVRDDSVDGLRVDHIDGIRRPARYLGHLSSATDGIYTVVEKILERGEELPGEWPVAGTTGYDFLNRVNSVFVDPGSEGQMTAIYTDVTGNSADYADVLHDSKRHVLQTSLAAELQRLTGLLAQICSQRRRQRDHTRRTLRESLERLIAAYPVYRLYAADDGEPSRADIHHAGSAMAEALRRDPELDRELLELVTDLSMSRVSGGVEAEFTRQFQQLTAPVMAKGAEDTAFYRYNRLISLNEVGGDPGTFGIDVPSFHQRTTTTAEQWPETMITIGTHDTKRSADVRARLNVLSEIPDEWRQAVSHWRHLTGRFSIDGVPDANTEYHFYQSVLGAWPIDVERMNQYMLKAMREAKTHTSWMSPDEQYESAVSKFVSSALADESFLSSVDEFVAHEDLVARGRRNSLRQVALLLTCPGVPDLYQGSELWDLSLVDPDNRRPVDYDLRKHISAGTDEPNWSEPGNRGDAKMWLTRRLLHDRRVDGTYEPLRSTGPRADHVVAYRSGGMLAVVPVRTDGQWADTAVDVPAGVWRNVLTGEAFDPGRHRLAELLGPAPLAVLTGDEVD